MLRAVGVAVVLVLWSGAGFAVEGVGEVNHACATTTGCFAGDTPGYPVQITQAGSYRLTSNLTVPASTDGVQLASGVDLDLGGFEIAGPVSCTPSCPSAGPGNGITGSPRCSVKNGKVRGFAGIGVALGQQARVQGVTVSDVANHGMALGGGSLATENLITRTGASGLSFSTSTQSLYRDNAILTTAQASVVGSAKASGPNTCTDQLCGTSGRKLFYLSIITPNGAAADTACLAGYHMASVFEIQDLSSVEYDDRQGFTQADAGQGPPTGVGREGWIRSGFDTAIGNCDAWTSSAAGRTGTTAELPTPGTPQVWETAVLVPCSEPHRVWCVQD